MFLFHPLTERTRGHLRDAGLDADAVAALVRSAVAEDLIGGADVTSMATIPVEQHSDAAFVARAEGVLAGVPVAAAVIDAVCGEDIDRFVYSLADGALVEPGRVVAEVAAPTRLLLTAERTALNLLCHLSGVATLTRRWADALGTGPTRVRDTRKTTPGLRAVEKYAVRCGGGVNHRMGLSDMALIKDNHVAAAGGIGAALDRLRAVDASLPVEVEVDDLDGLRAAIAAGADEVLIDNFSIAEMRDAVRVRDETNPAVTLEASGGLTIDDAEAVAATGVDFVAVGELTHSARSLDIGLDLRGPA
jgi:nicotinate-nucleotide pyrophosphorylase (carboxylating)